eukprot:gene20557-21217_t
MQSFNFLIRHIKGTLNALADYLSRMYPLPESPAAVAHWSKPTVLPIVKFLLNSHIPSETGYAPFQLRFCDRDMLYLPLPKDNPLPEQAE